MKQDPTSSKNFSFIRLAIISSVLWTGTLGGLYFWSVSNEIEQCSDLAYSQTKSFYQKFLMTRFWNAMHKGVYVPITEDSPPNPFLKNDPYRDLYTTVGMNLTKLNPAYMTRQISHLAEERSSVRFHLTALDPINPINIPDPWEEKVLQKMNNNGEHFELIRLDDGERIFRYLSMLTLEEACMECHEEQALEVGSTYGGISVSIPATPIIASRDSHIRTLTISHMLIWLIGLFSISMCSFRMYKNDEERKAIIEELQASQNEVQQLSGMLPICCSCKNIRDDKGYWKRVEQYIGDHADVEFTHGICPECSKKLYPDFCD